MAKNEQCSDVLCSLGIWDVLSVIKQTRKSPFKAFFGLLKFRERKDEHSGVVQCEIPELQ